MFDPATHGRDLVIERLTQQRSRRFELDLIPEPTRTQQGIDTQIEKCDAEIARLEAIVAALPEDPDQTEANARARAAEEIKSRAYQVKAENEIAQAAAQVSKVEGVTPETVMLQDPDAVLAVLASADTKSTNEDPTLA